MTEAKSLGELLDGQMTDKICENVECQEVYRTVFQSQKFCFKCLGALAEKNEREDRERAQALLMMDFERTCPSEYRYIDLGHKGIAQYLRQYEHVINWNWKSGRSLMLHGFTGRCKTRIAWQLVKKIYQSGQKVQTWDVSFPDELSSTFFESSKEGNRLMGSIQNHPIVFFDDFGKRWTESVEDRIFKIIDYRTSHRLPTIITTNHGKDAKTGDNTLMYQCKNIEDIGKPLVRRIADYFDTVAFK